MTQRKLEPVRPGGALFDQVTRAAMLAVGLVLFFAALAVVVLPALIGLLGGWLVSRGLEGGSRKRANRVDISVTGTKTVEKWADDPEFIEAVRKFADRAEDRGSPDA